MAAMSENEQYRAFLALRVRLVHGLRGVRRSVTVRTNDGREASLMLADTWPRFWRASVRALVAVAGDRLAPAELAILRDVGDDSPFLAILAEWGDRLDLALREATTARGLPDVVAGAENPGFWQPQSPSWHVGRPGFTREVSEIDMEVELEPADLPTFGAALVAVLRDVGEEGGRLAASLDLADLWEPMADAERVPMGALDMGDGLAPVRIFGPDPATCRALRALVLAVWRDRGGGAELWEAEEGRRERLEQYHAGTVGFDVVRRVIHPLRTGILSEDGGALLLRKGAGLVGSFPGLDAAAVLRIRENPGLFQSVAFPRLLRCFCYRTWEQAIEGVNPFTRLQFAGLAGLARAIGVSDKTEIANLPELLRAGQEYRGGRLDLPPLWTVQLPETMPRGSNVLTINVDVGPGMCPGYVSEGKKQDKWLLPVLSWSPSFAGISRRRRAMAEFLLIALLLELRDSVARGRRDGELIELSKGQCERAADWAGASRSELATLLEQWIGEGALVAEEGGPWLRRGPGDLVLVLEEGPRRVLLGAANSADRNRVLHKNKGPKPNKSKV